MPRPYDAIDHLQAAAERAGRKHELILETLQAADEAEAERWAAEIMARPCRSRSDGTPPLGRVRMSAASVDRDLADLAAVLRGLPVVERNACLIASGWWEQSPAKDHRRIDEQLVRRPDLADTVAALTDLDEDELRQVFQILSDEWSEQMAGFAKVEAEYSPMGRVS